MRGEWQRLKKVERPTLEWDKRRSHYKVDKVVGTSEIGRRLLMLDEQHEKLCTEI